MCDFGALIGYLAASEASIAAAIVLCGVAIVMNGAFWTAPIAYVPFGGAVFAVGVAAGAALTANAMLGTPGCSGPGGACAAQAQAAFTAMTVVTSALAATAAFGVVAAVTVAIPYVGVGFMAAYVVGMATTAVALVKATDAVAALQRCMESRTGFVGADILVGVAVALGLGIGGVLLAGISSSGPQDDGRDPFPKG